MNATLIPIKSLSDKALSEINTEHTGIPTGLYELDNKIRGLKPAEYIILAARPSMGKTSLATNIALSASLENKVIFFSIEMSPTLVAQRMLADLANVNLYKYHQDQMLSSAWSKLEKARTELSKRNIWFDSSSFISPIEIANKLSQVEDFDLVIVDYIQLMAGSGGNNIGRVEEMSEMSRRLKALAKDMNKPILVLSQLNRSPDIRDNHRPFLSDLRNSGSLEQDADIVLFLYRQGYYSREDDGSAEVIVAKNRNGPTGKIDCYFNRELIRFEDFKMKENDW